MTITLKLYSSIALSLLLFYSVSRTLADQVYYPRTMGKYVRRLNTTSPLKPVGRALAFGWIRTVLRTVRGPDSDVINLIGVDAFMFLRFVHLSLTYLLKISTLGLLVLVPLYYTGKSNGVEGLDRFSLTNLLDGDDPDATGRLWAPAVFGYVFTYMFVNMLEGEYEAFVKVRKRHVGERVASSGPRGGAAVKQVRVWGGGAIAHGGEGGGWERGLPGRTAWEDCLGGLPGRT